MRMRTWWIAAACCCGIAARAAHAESRMWTIEVKGITIQDVGDDDQPKGKPRPVAARHDGIMSCRLDAEPKGTYEPWIQGAVENGKFKMKHDGGGASKDIVSCATQAIVNTKLTGTGEFRVTAKVSFKPGR